MQPRSAHCIANGIRLHYLDFSTGLRGAPIVLLPGITSPAATWAFVAERLAQTHRVVVPDIRGRGLSENRPGLGYGLNDYARDIHGLINALPIEHPIVIGHSMGARIAARLAATQPGLASKLVLVDPPLSGPGRAPYPTPLQSYLTAIEAASRGASVEAFRAFTPTWTDEQIALRLEWLPTCTVEAVTESHRSFHTEDIFPDFPRLECPTLLVHAAKAKVVPAEEAAEIAALLPHGKAIPVEAGHMIPWDNLEDFLAVMQPFLLSS
ncbi:alpha/beta fold hydrolase [Lichenifustis flavocetrariae]|uniref:Alpha/beta hydrolase n=1 Tax=Lichenifustis flavocetrariae TaxID=2949735 RepID=A0AA41YVE7_9HYPH|nr:alpha/beta hydrolase [Lichenifustis flavocetrariae]MCW6507837.1 alpha/beta hydrolase [Lichenifustis flavocetrariae]